MFNTAFNSLSEVFLMQSQNGQNHGIFVWSVVVIVFISILATFIFYKKNIKKMKKKKLMKTGRNLIRSYKALKR